VRYRKGERTRCVAVGGGFAEIKDGQVLVVTPRFERISADDPHPFRTAQHMTEKWRREQKEFQREMVGYL
jgi:F0F1-type ATP synthase epsilon subunit